MIGCSLRSVFSNLQCCSAALWHWRYYPCVAPSAPDDGIILPVQQLVAFCICIVAKPHPAIIINFKLKHKGLCCF